MSENKDKVRWEKAASSLTPVKVHIETGKQLVRVLRIGVVLL